MISENMPKLKTICVTGISNGISQSIARILKDQNVAEKVVGCDIHSKHCGREYVDEFFPIARADDENFLNILGDAIIQHGIGMLIPTNDAEIVALSKAQTAVDGWQIPILMPNKLAVEVGSCKLSTVNFLNSLSLKSPWTRIVGIEDPLTLPCVVKKRHGRMSDGFAIVTDGIDLEWCLAKRQGDLWQELLNRSFGEYSCGIYRTLSGEVRTIALKRELKNGTTHSALVVKHPALEEYLTKFASGIDLLGSVNLQLMEQENGFVAFDLNARFSSSVYFRHILGFKDVIWSIWEALGEHAPAYDGNSVGKLCYKGSPSYFVYP